jgi:ferredoxin
MKKNIIILANSQWFYVKFCEFYVLQEEKMKVFVDAEVCTGCGLCTELCPEVFEMDDEVAAVIVDTIAPEEEDIVEEAIESCPVDAIIVAEE